MKVLFTLLFGLFFLSCNSDDDSMMVSSCENESEIDFTGCYESLSDPNANEEFAYDLTLGQIQFDTAVSPGYDIGEGSKVVFVYRHVDGINNEWIDDEFGERLLFEIDDNVISFTIDSEADFQASNCTYGACGAWYPNSMFQTFTGSITGSKISECEWSVEVDLIVDRFGNDRHVIQFSEDFSN